MAAISVVALLAVLSITAAGPAGATARAAAAPTETPVQRAGSHSSHHKQYAKLTPCQWPDLDGAAQHLSELIQFHTVGNASHPEHADPVVWDLLDLWMRDTYSDVFKALQVEKLGAGNLSYLLTWKGTRQDLKPVLFVAHTDVVPVPDSTLKDWTHPPFDGVIADGFIWGRGAMDVKVLVVLLMEGVSALLAQGYTPQRTLMLAFGHDEENLGTKGAALIADTLAARGTTLEFVLDEGAAVVMDGLPPLYTSPVVAVATAEKRFLQVEVTLSSKGGHSSMPPVDGSSIADRLGRFLSAMCSRPPPTHLVHPTTDLLAALGRLAPAGVSHLIQSASWLPPVRWLLAKLMARVQPETAAMVRTTAAVTWLHAGTADNVLPQTATVGMNFRLLPGDTTDTMVQLVKGWLGRDLPHAAIKVLNELPPVSTVADASGPHFAVIQAALQQHWRLDTPGNPPLQVVPLLVPGVTDSRYYMKLCRNGAAKFTPWTARQADADFSRLHGIDERLRVSDLACGLNSYRDLLIGFGQLGDAAGASRREPTRLMGQDSQQRVKL